MRLTWSVQRLVLAAPLVLSRSTMADRHAVEVTVADGPAAGHGEVVTSVFRRLDLAGIDAGLCALAPYVAGCDSAAALLAGLGDLRSRGLPLAVVAALDAAAHDLAGHQQGAPVHRLVGVGDWEPCPTARTLGVAGPEQTRSRARALALAGYRVLKVKVGGRDARDDIGAVRAVRAGAPEVRILLDANGGWDRGTAARVLDSVGEEVEAVEQPFPPGCLADLEWLAARRGPAVIADEDATVAADVAALAGLVDGVNVKLAECGGIGGALEMIGAAEAAGLEVMLGCLVASSLGLAPAVHLAPLARWVDLDGHLLLAADSWAGIGGHDGMLGIEGPCGLGVRRRHQPADLVEIP